MKLISADFQNFRLLRDLRLDFSVDDNRVLTVIRAENETGKTTILTALQWAFYGDRALPGGGPGFRLHPLDWDVSESSRVPVVVTVDFETTNIRRSQRRTIRTKRLYRVVRSTEERLNGTGWERHASMVKLFHVTDAGYEPLAPPEAQIHEELPPDLREVFFTDGDRALSFIEATAGTATKRERVQKTIRSLLGLGVIEDALKHVKKAGSEINAAAQRIDSGHKMTDVVTRLQEVERDAAGLETEIEDAKNQAVRLDEAIAENQKRIETALIRGNREDLQKQVEQTARQMKKVDEQRQAAAKEHVALFRSWHLSRDLLDSIFESAFAKLNDLHDRGKIPNTTIPVLEERLSNTLCICGESLNDAEPDGKRRRRHIQRMIDGSRAADELQVVVTDLYYGARAFRHNRRADDERWLDRYSAIAPRRDELEEMAEHHGKQRRALETRLSEIEDSGLQDLRNAQRHYRERRDGFHAMRTRGETRLEGLRSDQKSLTRQRDNLLKEAKKGALVLAQLHVTQDVTSVLNSAYQRMENEELAKVSDSMNAVFLKMIGSDPEQGSIINETRISDEFDIIVFGPNRHRLNPDRDLNGASRRALTMAFVLALTKVSEVEAPNVIDTPLGMMSGYVRRSVLRTAIDESSQLILFLTRSEIADCEEILLFPTAWPDAVANSSTKWSVLLGVAIARNNSIFSWHEKSSTRRKT